MILFGDACRLGDYSSHMQEAAHGRGSVLLVDDEIAMGDYLVEGLASAGFGASAVRSGEQALAQIDSRDFDALVTDVRMRGMDGIELCRRVRESTAELPVIVLTAFGDYALAVEAVRAGAYDFLAKPVKLDVLALALSRAVERRRLRQEVKTLQASRGGQRFRELIGDSAAMRKVHDLLSRVAVSEVSVLVTGESGTGKELVARTLHGESSRPGSPFVAINCAAVPENLLEAELFGDERSQREGKIAKPGLFAQADGGTLFLDEVSAIPLALQPKILRAIEDRAVRPLGAARDVPFRARLLTASNLDLETAVEEKRMREDFYFGLNVVEVRLPPLRARGNDVLALATHFLRDFAERANKPVTALTPEVGEKLLAYPWPGNVRELANVIERAVALTHHDHVTVHDLPEKIAEHRRSHVVLTDATEFVTLEEMERRYILQILGAVGGSKSVAARTLGLDRTTLWRKLERYQEAGKQGKG
jgi:DNA-binding NtrC family response regulator